MKIAVTGGTGFLGGYLLDILIKENHVPIVLTREKQDKLGYCEYRTTDYSVRDLKSKLFDIDAVVHLAAKRGSQGKISEFQNNEDLTQNLYDACLELGISNIVFASTISVYSNESLLPWNEQNLPSPTLMYGISKLTNEHIGNIYSTKKGLFVKNLRFAHLFGFNEKNNYMINRFFRQAFHGEQLIVNGKSLSKREFLYGKDAAKAILCALKKDKLAGTYNIGSDEAFTNYEVAEVVQNEFGNTGNILINNPHDDEGINSSYMDSRKAEKDLDFKTDYTFSTAVAEIHSLMRGLDDVPLWY